MLGPEHLTRGEETSGSAPFQLLVYEEIREIVVLVLFHKPVKNLGQGNIKKQEELFNLTSDWPQVN